MTTVIFIRHGESEGNLSSVFAGSSDFPLTERGRIQARRTAEYLDRYPIDAVYSSDLARARQTAEPLAERRHLPILEDKGLREIDGGAWEGVPFAALASKYPGDFREWMDDMANCRCPGGESVADVYARVRDAIARIVARHPGGTVAIVMHATPIRTQKCLWLGLPLTDIGSYGWVSNASFTVCEYDGGWRLVLDGYDAHLAELHTELPKEI